MIISSSLSPHIKDGFRAMVLGEKVEGRAEILEE